MLAAHFGLVALLLSFIDVRDRRVPRKIVYLALLSLIFISGPHVLIFSVMSFLLYLLIFIVSRGALGLGDLRLSLLTGAYIGSSQQHLSSFLVLNFMSWLSATFFIFSRRILQGRSASESLPFAPFMFLAPILGFSMPEM